jgi:hypothetical protein
LLIGFVVVVYSFLSILSVAQQLLSLPMTECPSSALSPHGVTSPLRRHCLSWDFWDLNDFWDFDDL